MQDSNEDIQWGYIIMTLIILFLFEIALILLVKYNGSELFQGLYVQKWQVLNFTENNEQIQRNIENRSRLNIDNEGQTNDGHIRSSNNNRRSQNQIRIIQSRSVLSNNQQDIAQNNQKSQSRINLSRVQSQNANDNSRAQNYSLGMFNFDQKQENTQQNLQFQKNRSINQIKANQGFNNCDQQIEEGQQEFNENQLQINDQNNNLNYNQQHQRNNSSQQLLNFIKNNIDLYSNVVKAYNNIDDQFILSKTEVEKNMTILISSENKQQQNHFNTIKQNIKQSCSNKKIIHLIGQEEDEEESKSEEQKENQNKEQPQNQCILIPKQMQTTGELQQTYIDGSMINNTYLLDFFKQNDTFQQNDISKLEDNLNQDINDTYSQQNIKLEYQIQENNNQNNNNLSKQNQLTSSSNSIIYIQNTNKILSPKTIQINSSQQKNTDSENRY